MPKESAIVESAGVLVGSNPFGEQHRTAAAALGVHGGCGPVWDDLASRQTLIERLGPFVQRLRARAQRSDRAPLQKPEMARLLDGLAAAWVAVAPPDDPDANDLRWLGRAGVPSPDALASERVARLRSLESIRRAWPGNAPAARKLRAAIWRATRLTDSFLQVRGAEQTASVPVLIIGPDGSPRPQVAMLLGAAAASPSPSEAAWHCRLPAADAASRIRGGGVGFVDRLEHASETTTSALIERLSSPQPRCVFGVTTGTEQEVDAELWHRVAGVEVEIPPLPALTVGGGLPEYIRSLILAMGADDDRSPEVIRWIERRVGSSYAWPGHLAELARCVRARLNDTGFAPTPTSSTNAQLPAPLLTGLYEGAMDADTLLSRYCTWVYALTGSYIATAGRLGMDRRTVRRRVDRALLPIFADHRPD